MKKLLYFCLLFVWMIPSIVFSKDLELSSKEYLLYDLDKNMVLYEKDSDKIVSIASLTKIMTTIVAIENIDDCETEFGDFIEDKENSKESIEKKILNDEFREALINARLTDKEKFVILNRFGFIDGENHTLEEIGQMVGVTRERVRQIENKSIRKLRKDPKIKKFA